VVLADEPTGNLDSRTSEEIMALLSDLNQAGKTIIMVTHETDIASWARRVVRMRDGIIESDARNESRHHRVAPATTAVQAGPTLTQNLWLRDGNPPAGNLTQLSE
jgi:energy-coupling factor transporter ATP-binding protein EcfA2